MIDFGRGMIFPNSYGRDQPDGPDPCDECEGLGYTAVSDGEGFAIVSECPECHGTGQVG